MCFHAYDVLIDICVILFCGFVSFNIVVLATQIQIFHGTHPEMIEDQV